MVIYRGPLDHAAAITHKAKFETFQGGIEFAENSRHYLYAA